MQSHGSSLTDRFVTHRVSRAQQFSEGDEQ
jgi:hypothetical protein